MKVLVTGATGYIGGAVARALTARGHQTFGLARSARAANTLRAAAITPVMGDFTDHHSLTDAVTSSSPDAVVSTASVGSLGGDADTFTRDRDAIATIIGALGDDGKTLIFTSGSAVLGVFADGHATTTVYDENARVPLSPAVFAPPSARVHAVLVAGFGAAMAARVATEQAVKAAPGIRGIVIRPGLVYGHGGSYDIPAAITLGHRYGAGVHLGAGDTLQSYIHIDDLAELYCLAVEHAPVAATLHGVTADISQRQIATAVGHLIGAGGLTKRLTTSAMLGLNSGQRIGMSLTRHLPGPIISRLQTAAKPPDGAATGISLCLNKRLASTTTQKLLGWSPNRTDIVNDIESGSYRI
jgi:nucleoside-diphosphate-sugar epimerase